jgi:very-short-patch-repair endonuclease
MDTEQGRLVRPDFAFEEYKTLVEYQGDYHRLTKAQWRKDMTRRSRLEAAGWIVLEINADDLRDPNELVARLAALLRRQGWTGRTQRVFAQITW